MCYSNLYTNNQSVKPLSDMPSLTSANTDVLLKREHQLS